ncbi:ABC transporter permease [Morganella morganii]|uniref:ABC transporter permease n=1 Tax=Morganella morganii TaxID=582 RepID=UPI0018D76777|nr:ABC transporter permease [Morganella morganii]
MSAYLCKKSRRATWTLLLGCTGLFISLTLSFYLGVRAGIKPDSWCSRVITLTAICLQTVPPFVLALVVLSLFAIVLNWFPTGGLTYPGQSATVWSTLTHLVLPGLVLAITQLPWLILSLRESVNEVMASDAIRGARVRGIPLPRIISHHIVPTALPPFVALAGSRLPELVAGSILVESIFAWPGLGSALVRSAQSLDFPLLTILTVAITVLVLIGNLMADIIFVILDPQVDADG